MRRVSVIIAALGVLAVAWLLLRSGGSVPDGEAPLTSAGHAAQPVLPAEALPPMQACMFWEPWHALIAPETPVAALERLHGMVSRRAERSAAFVDWASRPSSRSESVCIRAVFRGENLALDISDVGGRTDQCHGFIHRASEYSLWIRVQPGKDGRNINELDFRIGSGEVTPERLRQFLSQQAALLHHGYSGWQAAFPAFADTGRSGVQTIVRSSGLRDSHRELSMRAGWDPQKFWKNLPSLATYMLSLARLVEVGTDVTDAEGRLIARGLTSTLATATEFHMAFSDQGLRARSLKSDAPMHREIKPDIDSLGFTVAHDVTVRFRGLEITIQDLAFTGQLMQSTDQIRYQGRFAGIGPVDVTGRYRSFALGGMGDLIRDTVRDIIRKESDALAHGRDGKGWTIEAGLGRLEGYNAGEVRMAFESPVNLIELLRHETRDPGPVMPGQSAQREFNVLSLETIGALVSDAKAGATCPMSH